MDTEANEVEFDWDSWSAPDMGSATGMGSNDVVISKDAYEIGLHGDQDLFTLYFEKNTWPYDLNFNCALQGACLGSEIEFIKFILERMRYYDFEVDWQKAFNHLFHHKYCANLEVIKLLDEKSHEDDFDCTEDVLKYAAYSDDSELAIWFLEKYACNPDDFTTPIDIASRHASFDVLKALVEALCMSVDIVRNDITGMINRCIHNACINGSFQIVKWLIETFENVIRYISFAFALSKASSSGFLVIVVYLFDKIIARKQDPNIRHKIVMATVNGHIDVVKYLLGKYDELCEVPWISHKSLDSALYFACKNGYVQIAEELLEAGAKYTVKIGRNKRCDLNYHEMLHLSRTYNMDFEDQLSDYAHVYEMLKNDARRILAKALSNDLAIVCQNYAFIQTAITITKLQS